MYRLLSIGSERQAGGVGQAAGVAREERALIVIVAVVVDQRGGTAEADVGDQQIGLGAARQAGGDGEGPQAEHQTGGSSSFAVIVLAPGTSRRTVDTASSAESVRGDGLGGEYNSSPQSWQCRGRRHVAGCHHSRRGRPSGSGRARAYDRSGHPRPWRTRAMKTAGNPRGQVRLPARLPRHLRDGRRGRRRPAAVDLRGDADHPFTRGVLCGKMASYLDHVYRPDRLLHPAQAGRPEGRRAGSSRSAGTRPSTRSPRRFAAIAASADGPQAILPYSYYGTMGKLQASSLDRRFFHRLGASMLDRTICASAGGAGLRVHRRPGPARGRPDGGRRSAG